MQVYSTFDDYGRKSRNVQLKVGMEFVWSFCIRSGKVLVLLFINYMYMVTIFPKLLNNKVIPIFLKFLFLKKTRLNSYFFVKCLLILMT